MDYISEASYLSVFVHNAELEKKTTSSFIRKVTWTGMTFVMLQAMLPPAVDEQIYKRFISLTEPSMVTRLYLCGSLDNPERIPEILKNGFEEIGNANGNLSRSSSLTIR